MVNSYLVQRLKKPLGDWNPFSFGGGGGHFSEEAQAILSQVCSFEYMGSAEFEWGEVPRALEQISKGEYCSRLFQIEGTEVYAIVPVGLEGECCDRIREFGSKPYHTTKEVVKFWDALFPTKTKFPADTVGWIELDNGFAWFIDKEMFNQFCQLLGVN